MNDNQSAASRSGHGKNGIGIGQANDGTRFDFVVGTAVRQIQYNRLHPMTRCVTCGAKTNQNKRTCSAICTRARRNRVSRAEQIRRDMDAHPWERLPMWNRIRCRHYG